jgi:selenocysteine-specific elongation factor
LVRAAGRLLDAGVWETAAEAVLVELERSHRDDPLRSGVPREMLRRSTAALMGPETFRALLEELVRREEVRLRGDRVASAEHDVVLGPEDAARSDAIDRAFREGGLDPPEAEDVARERGGPQGGRLVELLVERGRLVRIVDGRLFHAQVLDELRGKVRAFGRTSSTMDVAAFKELAGVTRKNAIPLLEQLDAERVTRRVGNRREILARDATD